MKDNALKGQCFATFMDPPPSLKVAETQRGEQALNDGCKTTNDKPMCPFIRFKTLRRMCQ
ncbi:hypothetical protein K523DRAFT_324297 [Schizophyllum commune Tattone D]|nr:hypothetical protein K523DRAFT_324297 [Schizophyllum commune Tattone D]